MNDLSDVTYTFKNFGQSRILIKKYIFTWQQRQVFGFEQGLEEELIVKSSVEAVELFWFLVHSQISPRWALSPFD